MYITVQSESDEELPPVARVGAHWSSPAQDSGQALAINQEGQGQQAADEDRGAAEAETRRLAALDAIIMEETSRPNGHAKFVKVISAIVCNR